MTKCSLLAGAVLILLPLVGEARQPPSNSQPSRVAQTTALARPPQPTVAPTVAVSNDQDAGDTRDRLRTLLEQYPPSLRQVLRIDNSLLSRPDYLAAYPALAAFLQQHPEVVRNPVYFVGDASGIFPDDSQPADPRIEAVRAWRGIAEMIPVVAIVFIITSALTGLIRTFSEQRRWQRAARMQMEIQTKLVDRFAGSEELLAYLQSPAGRGLADLRALPVGATAAPRSMDAPLGRIFWSLQSGIVLAAAGVGLLVVGGRLSTEELSQPFASMGVLALAVGVGFVASAGISYLISQRLGLVAPASPSGFHSEPPTA